MPDSYLMHHGIKGMKWGVRRFEDASGHLTPAGKRRYAVQDARKYYKINRLQRAREKTDNERYKKILDGEIRRTKTRSDRKHSDLSKRDINVGREIVAKHRLKWAAFNTVAKSALTAAGAAYLYSNPKTRALAPLAVAGGAALTFKSAKKVPYYFMENRRYKQVNEKGATQKGLTKRQKQLRKVGKAAIGVALAGAAGYALVKSGAVQKAVDTYKGTLPFDKAVKVAKKEERIKNAFGIKTGQQKQKEQFSTEGRTSNSTYQSTKKGPSEATRAILEANQRATAERKVNNGTAKIRSNGTDRPMTSTEQRLWNTFNRAGSSIKQGGSRVIQSGKNKAISSIKERVLRDTDYDDALSYVKAVKNTIDTGREIKGKIDDILGGGERATAVVREETAKGIASLVNRVRDIKLPRKEDEE